jgi:4-aminobutyrate aminotransferase
MSSCHPAVSNAVHAQVDTLTHLQCSIGFHLPYLQLIERLKEVMPHEDLDSFFFWNSGSEAIEAAIKLARKATGRQNVISMVGGYHGRTYGMRSSISFDSANRYRIRSIDALQSQLYQERRSSDGEPCSAISDRTTDKQPGAYATPFPYWHSMSMLPSTSEDELVRIAIAQLDLLFKQQCDPSDTAAIFIEPVIGEG